MKMKNDSLISNTPFDWLTRLANYSKKKKKRKIFERGNTRKEFN